MKLVLDTNKYKDLSEGDPKTLQHVRFADTIAIPFVVLAEIKSGLRLKSKTLQNEKILNRFLNLPRVKVLYPDEETIEHYSHLYIQLRRQGTPIPTHDLWIAALTLQHRMNLLTRDQHFKNIPQLTLVE